MGRGTHLRGVIKTKARALVESTYGFEVSGDNAIEGNCKKVERLKDALGFVYRVRSFGYPSSVCQCSNFMIETWQ